VPDKGRRGSPLAIDDIPFAIDGPVDAFTFPLLLAPAVGAQAFVHRGFELNPENAVHFPPFGLTN